MATKLLLTVRILYTEFLESQEICFYIEWSAAHFAYAAINFDEN